ncbi:glycosyltransferase family 4 protein [Candidatus Bipolaricaulota bacterium]|nr:glycosyltransferase family 4 protein [Candidatus Bipolaricaulota bacterium]
MTKEEETYRILLLTAEFPPQIGGIATLTSQLAGKLHEREYNGREVEVHVVTSVGKERNFPFPVTRTPDFLNWKLLKIFPLLLATFWICLKERPDKLLLGKWTHEAFVAYPLYAVFRIPYVTLVHGSEILKFKKQAAGRFILRKLLERGEKVVPVSNYTRDLLIQLGIPEENLVVVNNGLDLDDYDLDLDADECKKEIGVEGKTVLLTVSRLVERKGHDHVLRALAEIKDDHPDIVYLIAGDGSYRKELERQVDELNLEEYVRVLGFVKGGYLDIIYNASDIFVMPNRMAEDGNDVEGFGISFLEANLFGLPVIGGRSGGAVDAIEDGETGFLVNPEDVEEIKRKLVELIQDEKLRVTLGNQGRKRVINKMNSEVQADKLAEVLCDD